MDVQLRMFAALVLLTIGVVIGGCSQSAMTSEESSQEIGAASRGGSNYNFYRLDGCTREPYGVIYNYDVATSTINEQLASMYVSGQRRLRIMIFHGHGLGGGTLMDSTGGNFAPRFRNNLTNLLAAIRNQGYVEVEIAFGPQGPNVPLSWSSWNEAMYQENWNLIYNLHPIIANAGIAYRIDLMNEGTPTSNQSMLLRYAQRLWADYTYRFGKNDTLGFSIIAENLDRIAQIPNVYRGNLPYLFDLHFYGNSSRDEYSQFVNARNRMRRMGLSQGWIIGESFYNDPVAANNLRRAIDATGQTVFFLTQWPLTRSRRCSDVDVAPPSGFDNYSVQGF